MRAGHGNAVERTGMTAANGEESKADILPSCVIRGGIVGLITLDRDAAKIDELAPDASESESASDTLS